MTIATHRARHGCVRAQLRLLEDTELPPFQMIAICFELARMSNPSNHLAVAGGGAAMNHHNSGKDLGSNTGTLSEQAAAAAVQLADDYDSSNRLSLASGSRSFDLDTDKKWEDLLFKHQDAVDRFNLSDASTSEETKQRITHGIDRRDELFLDIANIPVKGKKLPLTVAMQEEGFNVGKYVCHGFDGLAYDFQRYSVYEVWRCASPLIDFIYVTHHHNQL